MNPYIKIWLEELESEDVHADPCAEYLAPITARLRCSIIACVNRNNYQPINDLLFGLSPTCMRTDVMVAVLRTLFPLRYKLSNYQLAVQKVESELTLRGKDVNRILQGLTFKKELTDEKVQA